MQSFSKHLPWFRCGRKRKHLNLTARQNPAANPLTTNALQEVQQPRPRFRSLAGQECRRMQMRTGDASGRGIHQTCNRTEQHMHLNRSKTRKIHRNTLINFLLQGFNKHIHRFRCSGKWEHLTPAERQNPAFNSLTTNTLQDFQQLRQRFRSQPGLEHHRMQIHSGGASG